MDEELGHDSEGDTAAVTPAVTKLVTELADQLEGRVSTTNALRHAHSRDESRHPPVIPEAVFFPATADDVVTIVSACASAKIPITPFGTGTGLEGAAIPVPGGVSIDTSAMNRVLAVHAEDFDVVVQPGLTHRSLNQILRTSGLF